MSHYQRWAIFDIFRKSNTKIFGKQKPIRYFGQSNGYINHNIFMVDLVTDVECKMCWLQNDCHYHRVTNIRLSPRLSSDLWGSQVIVFIYMFIKYPHGIFTVRLLLRCLHLWTDFQVLLQNLQCRYTRSWRRLLSERKDLVVGAWFRSQLFWSDRFPYRFCHLMDSWQSLPNHFAFLDSRYPGYML